MMHIKTIGLLGGLAIAALMSCGTFPASTASKKSDFPQQDHQTQVTTEVQNSPDDLANLPSARKQDPTIPAPGYFPKYPQAWLKFHKKYLQQTRKGKINIVFLGDSITQGWRKHKKLWQEEYGSRGAVNFGIGGDRTQQILWRIDHGLFDHMRPKLVVLNIGVNNLWGKSSNPVRIAAGIEKIVNVIHTKSPQTKILLLGIFPTGKQPNTPIRKRIRALNALVAKLDNGRTIRFLDIGSQFLEADGKISKAVMPDYLHLSGKGYQIWATSIHDPFTQMLKENSMNLNH
jgi:lysophospholipase L1-like esterase